SADWSARGERATGGDLLAQLADVARRLLGAVPAGTERVGPLPLGEAREQIARPAYVRRRDVGEQLGTRPAIIELHVPARDAGDEPLLFEPVQVVRRAVEQASRGAAERGADVAQHVPALRPLALAIEIEDRVLLRLQVPVVDDHVEHEKPAKSPGPDERIVLP